MKTAKKLNSTFVKMYLGRWMYLGKSYRWGATLFRVVFGNENKLPIESGFAIIQSTIAGENISANLILKWMGPKGTRKHRVFVECSKCKKEVPAGRIHQHKC